MKRNAYYDGDKRLLKFLKTYVIRLVLLCTWFLMFFSYQSSGQSVFLFGILIVDSIKIDEVNDGVELNVDLRDENHMVSNTTGKTISEDVLLKKLEYHCGRGLNKLKFIFHDLEEEDSTFFYWQKIKKIVSKVSGKYIDFEFKKVDFLPNDFFLGLGSIDGLTVKFDQLNTSVDCGVLTAKLTDFTFGAGVVGNNAKLLPPLNVENLFESSQYASIPIELLVGQKVNYKNLVCSSTNLNRFVFGLPKLSYINVSDNVGKITLTSNVLSNTEAIELNLGSLSTRINVEFDKSLERINSIIISSSPSLVIDGNKSVLNLNIDPVLYKVSESLAVFIEYCDRVLMMDILSHTKAKEILFSSNGLYIDDKIIEKLRTMPHVTFTNCAFNNKTSFTLEEIKKQLPNCKFD
jgi:hypothetical protein